MNIFKQIKDILISEFKTIYADLVLDSDLNKISVEQPKDETHGDASTNIAMIFAKQLSANPREIALKLKERLDKIELFTRVDIAGPGFINFFLNPTIYVDILHHIIANPNFGTSSIGNNKKVNLEFVSANPTGPLHIGHLRNATFGSALANVLKFVGFDVTKEFYVNDAGSQIDVLAKSCYLRYKEICTNTEESIPAGLYPGEYLKDVAQQIFDKYSTKYLNAPKAERVEIFKTESVNIILEIIKENLKLLGISFDVFFSEKSLHKENIIENVISKLEKKGLLYTGILEAPKDKKNDDWEPREQLLFKSTLYGDDSDRALKKSDGTWTYLSADIAYLDNKITRGFDQLIFVLGADHGGYEARLKAACKALSDNKTEIDIKITQLVNFVKNGKPVKMSKRSGNFLLVEEVVKEVGKDAACFSMLTRRNDQSIEFDFEKVKEATKDNPVFYVQYAHARVMSVFRAASKEFPEILTCFDEKKYDLTLIKNPQVLSFIKQLALYPRIIELAAIHHEPHRVVFYLMDLAAHFHQLWSLGREHADARFLNHDNIILSASYLAIIRAFKNIIVDLFLHIVLKIQINALCDEAFIYLNKHQAIMSI